MLAHIAHMRGEERSAKCKCYKGRSARPIVIFLSWQMPNPQARRWQFTRFLDEENGESINDLVASFKSILRRGTRRWVFQVETTEAGRIHLQGRVSFKNPKRLTEARLDDRTHMSIEHDSTAGDFYVTKDESRVEGPYSDKDENYISEAAREAWKIDQFNDVQIEMWNRLCYQNRRQITFVYDPNGCVGKTTFIMWMVINKNALQVPSMLSSAEDMCQFVYNHIKDGQYLLMDIGRACSSEKHWNKWLDALEGLKNGYVFDKRYTGKFKYVAPPKIMVMCNNKPPEHLLSADRFDVYDVSLVS